MATSKVTYLGGLRTENLHLKSQSTFITDAPLDNHGKGEAFSPTDTVATGLVNCMLTVMGIKARDLGEDLTGSVATVSKTMAVNPRRISAIEIEMELPATVSERNRKVLQNTADTCPVIYSLHPDIAISISYHWSRN